MVRLTQMKWKGTVSQSGTIRVATRLQAANTPQPTSSHAAPGRSGHLRDSDGIDAVPLPSHRDDGAGTQLVTQSPDVDVDHVGAGIEAVAPDGGQQVLLGHRLAGALHQLPQEQELPLG